MKQTKKQKIQKIKETPIERIRYNLLKDDEIELSQGGKCYFTFHDDTDLYRRRALEVEGTQVKTGGFRLFNIVNNKCSFSPRSYYEPFKGKYGRESLLVLFSSSSIYRRGGFSVNRSFGAKYAHTRN